MWKEIKTRPSNLNLFFYFSFIKIKYLSFFNYLLFQKQPFWVCFWMFNNYFFLSFDDSECMLFLFSILIYLLEQQACCLKIYCCVKIKNWKKANNKILGKEFRICHPISQCLKIKQTNKNGFIHYIYKLTQIIFF